MNVLIATMDEVFARMLSLEFSERGFVPLIARAKNEMPDLLKSAHLALVDAAFKVEKDGVLANPDDDSSVIPLITRESYKDLLEKGMIVGGMIPKLDNAFAALENGVAEVFIKHADNLLNNKETLLQL